MKSSLMLTALLISFLNLKSSDQEDSPKYLTTTQIARRYAGSLSPKLARNKPDSKTYSMLKTCGAVTAALATAAPIMAWVVYINSLKTN